MIRVVLAGNPNCGKTTLFNALTGENQRVGNWPGVTVERKTGEILVGLQTFELTDLPGVYSLMTNAQGTSQDEYIATTSLIELNPDCIINVVDACHLERHLYLTTQLLELGKPLILVLNMMDIAKQRGITIDTATLEKELGCPVIAIQAHKKLGVPELVGALTQLPKATKPLTLSISSEVKQALTHLEHQLLGQNVAPNFVSYYALRMAEGDTSKAGVIPFEYSELELDVLLADARYKKIHEITQAVQTKQSDASNHLTAQIDKVVMHRFFALPLFFTIMYLMFLFAISIGGAFQDFVDISTDTVFVQGSAWLLQQCHAPGWLIALLANGLGKGINTTLTFIPVIACMFFFLSLLEASGYMARAAFVVDKIMRLMGLPGKSFVPMIVGFGCNVPAILGARTLDSERDRLLTVMMSPFMSCSARLAIYAVFVAAFFPTGGQNIVFSLYLVGILMAVLTGFILKNTALKGHAAPLILELPAYHKPSMKRLLKETGMRLRFFLFRAGKLIIPICLILGALNAITLSGDFSASEASTQSLLSIAGQWITPIFAPMGITQDNWPATVGLLTGTLAKEVVVGTLNSLYSQVGHLGEAAATHFDFWAGMQTAWQSLIDHLTGLGAVFSNPLTVIANKPLSNSVYGMMVSRFDGQVGAYAYLLFVLLYIPCVSTMAVIRQEANSQLMWVSIGWSFVLAYTVAVLFYQIARFSAHPQQSLFWIISMLLVLATFIGLFYLSQTKNGGRYVVANS